MLQYIILFVFGIYLMNKGKRLTKRNLQTITIFQYYIKHLFPALKPELLSDPNQPTQFKTNYRSILYNYIFDVTRGFDKVDFNTVFSILKSMYLSDLEQRISQNQGVKLHPLHIKYTPLSTLIQDHIQVLVQHGTSLKESTKEQEQRSSRTSFGKSSASNPFSSECSLKSKEEFYLQNEQQNVTFYVIHSNPNKDDDSLSWLNFVEKYEFTNIKGEEERNAQPVIIYQAAYSYNNQGWKFNMDFSGVFLQKYFEQCCPVISNKSLKLNCLVQQIKKSLRKKIETAQKRISNASFENSHRRYLRLNKKHLPIFEQLKYKSISYLRKINPSNKENTYFIQNTVCRMMENCNFSLEQSQKALMYYFDQQKRLRDRYTWQSFQEFHKMNIFNYIGKDSMGRPVLLNRMRNCLMSKIQDKQLFFDYHLYMFQVFLQDKMEGWVDQFNVIVDGDGQVNDNTDISFSKHLLTEIFKLTLGRPHHLIGFNIGILGKILFKIMFPLLPEKVLKHVEMFGNDSQQEVVEKLKEIMPIQTIPDFLGGENRKTQYYDQNNARQNENSYDVSFEHSLDTNQKRK